MKIIAVNFFAIATRNLPFQNQSKYIMNKIQKVFCSQSNRFFAYWRFGDCTIQLSFFVRKEYREHLFCVLKIQTKAE